MGSTKRFTVQVARRGGKVVSVHTVRATDMAQASQGVALAQGLLSWNFVDYTWEAWRGEGVAMPTPAILPKAEYVLFVSELT